MKTIIAGSRECTDLSSIFQCINSVPWEITEVVSGTARGVDRAGEEWGRANNVPIKQFPADWDKYGKSAGYIRNAEMAKYADALVAVWNGESRGTMHMIRLAKKEGLKVKVFVANASQS